MAPPTQSHFLTRTTTEQVCAVLDRAESADAAVVVVQFCGGRDWVVVTRGFVPGPAGSRVFQSREE